MPELGMNALQQRQFRRQSAAIKSNGAILQSVPLGGWWITFGLPVIRSESPDIR
jgi:hypothetical protein